MATFLCSGTEEMNVDSHLQCVYVKQTNTESSNLTLQEFI